MKEFFDILFDITANFTSRNSDLKFKQRDLFLFDLNQFSTAGRSPVYFYICEGWRYIHRVGIQRPQYICIVHLPTPTWPFGTLCCIDSGPKDIMVKQWSIWTVIS